eukprot:TRINITY_DN7969_c0_g1_i1.p1 TRINITY_DN7969_c0_g1~~TRINITY_DN7969_c0_g1_i1.p1  ORF type:complete len:813 (+),score=65.56 TRINITY_DN7969_c0_g1_i1:34-2472(+)
MSLINNRIKDVDDKIDIERTKLAAGMMDIGRKFFPSDFIPKQIFQKFTDSNQHISGDELQSFRRLLDFQRKAISNVFAEDGHWKTIHSRAKSAATSPTNQKNDDEVKSSSPQEKDGSEGEESFDEYQETATKCNSCGVFETTVRFEGTLTWCNCAGRLDGECDSNCHIPQFRIISSVPLSQLPRKPQRSPKSSDVASPKPSASPSASSFPATSAAASPLPTSPVAASSLPELVASPLLTRAPASTYIGHLHARLASNFVDRTPNPAIPTATKTPNGHRCLICNSIKPFGWMSMLCNACTNNPNAAAKQNSAEQPNAAAPPKRAEKKRTASDDDEFQPPKYRKVTPSVATPLATRKSSEGGKEEVELVRSTPPAEAPSVQKPPQQIINNLPHTPTVASEVRPTIQPVVSSVQKPPQQIINNLPPTSTVTADVAPTLPAVAPTVQKPPQQISNDLPLNSTAVEVPPILQAVAPAVQKPQQIISNTPQTSAATDVRPTLKAGFRSWPHAARKSASDAPKKGPTYIQTLEGGYRSNDITGGKYKVPISLVNNVDKEPFPEMKWLTKNIYKVPIPADSPKEEYCMTLCKKCKACACSKQNVGSYNKDGCFIATGKSDPSVPDWIYECSDKCHCDPKKCLNRVVQNGPTKHLELFKDAEKGWGLRTKEALAAGTFICEYFGEVMKVKDCKRSEETFVFDLDHRQFEKIEPEYTIDATTCGNASRFLNHSCDPNLKSSMVWIEHRNLSMPHVAFFTTRKVKANEELTLDYGIPMNPCFCNTAKCTERQKRHQLKKDPGKVSAEKPKESPKKSKNSWLME